jgi:FixJ family two-component response regulator
VAFTGAHQQYAAQVVPELTEREREVLELVAASLGNHKIARRLEAAAHHQDRRFTPSLWHSRIDPTRENAG